MSTDYIAHHGIKGQKWGIRNYQNPDGSLTPAGKLRYNENGTLTKAGKSRAEKDIRSGKSSKLAGAMVGGLTAVSALKTVSSAAITGLMYSSTGTGAALAMMTVGQAVPTIAVTTTVAYLLRKSGKRKISEAMQALADDEKLIEQLNKLGEKHKDEK